MLISNTSPQYSGLYQKGFYDLIEIMPAMILMQDKESAAYFFNKAWLAFTGVTTEQQSGTGWMNIIHPDDLPLLNDEKVKQKLARKEEYALKLRLKRADDVYIPISITASPVFVETNFIGYMLTCLDASAENEKVQLSHQLKNLNDDFDQFIYATSHDLQEPLRTIASYVHLLSKSIDKGDYKGVKEFMGFVLSGTERVQQLIHDLLQYSRVNKRGTDFTLVNMNEVLKLALANLSETVEKNGALITAETLPIVSGDTFQLIRLFQNLIDNAIKFKTPGSKPELYIYVKEKADDYEFVFKDKGIGLESKFYNRIFAIFQRLHARDEYEGTGIGLAICKKIVERHGGQIWVDSQPGKGSTFYFTIKK